jgi:EAL domain-containing protein (putative c-di-GMP-specific phosphodiesterase class I)
MNDDQDLFAELTEPEAAITEQATAIEAEPNPLSKRRTNAKRKWKNEEDKFSAGFFIRCTQAEKFKIKEEAQSFDMSESRFLVAKALNARRVLTSEELNLFGNILQELSALGRNVNQVARALNSARLAGTTVEVTQNHLLDIEKQAQNLIGSIRTETTKLWQS